MTTPEAKLARNIDTALEAVEEILNVLIEISRLDAGKLDPDITVFPLSDIFERLELEFLPLARAKGLELQFVPTRLWVSSDRRLLRRVLQNLLSNAIKYTSEGKVLLGVRRSGDKVRVEVWDTGPGIPKAKSSLIFKEFSAWRRRALGPRTWPGIGHCERIERSSATQSTCSQYPGGVDVLGRCRTLSRVPRLKSSRRCPLRRGGLPA